MTDDPSDQTIDVLQGWIERQTLKSTPMPSYNPVMHLVALGVIGSKLLADNSIAGGKMSATLRAIIKDPKVTRNELTEQIFSGNAGYTLQIVWPLVSIFSGQMPRKVASSTATSYIGWLDRIRRVVLRDLTDKDASAVTSVIEAVSDSYAQAASTTTHASSEAMQEVEGASGRVDTNQPGIYVFTTPTYLAYPPFGWDTEDLSRQDFRFLKTGSSAVDVTGRVQTEIRRQTGLPEPYIILAKFQGPDSAFDYAAAERQIHKLLAAARHGPEEDGSRRSAARGAGTEWFITRLPFVMTVAEAVGLHLAVSDDLKRSVNDMFEDCELPDWVIP